MCVYKCLRRCDVIFLFSHAFLGNLSKCQYVWVSHEKVLLDCWFQLLTAKKRREGKNVTKNLVSPDLVHINSPNIYLFRKLQISRTRWNNSTYVYFATREGTQWFRVYHYVPSPSCNDIFRCPCSVSADSLGPLNQS